VIGIFYSALAALGDIGGGLLVVWRTGRDRELLAALTGFGAGFMLALVILGMLPHAVDVRGGFIAVLPCRIHGTTWQERMRKFLSL
jgi:zinc transporter ZupT